MTREEMVELVEKIKKRDCDDEELDRLVEEFHANTAHPMGTDLIFYHKPKLTTDEIVDKALAAKATPLPPPSSDS